MSERLPVPADVLRHRIGPPRVEREANAAVHRLFDLADRGGHLEAAEQAADLLRGMSFDVRLVAIYLAGTFSEGGVAALPELLERARGLLEPRPPSLESDGSSKAVDSALEWLFRTVLDRLTFHTTQRDAVWKTWIAAITPEDVERITARCDALFAPHHGSGESLQKLSRWARDKLGPAVTGARKAARAQAEAPDAKAPDAEAPDAEAPDAEAPDAEAPGDGGHPPALHPIAFDEGADPQDDASSFSDADHDDALWCLQDDSASLQGDLRTPHSVVIVDSPALAALRDKLQGFEILLSRGDLDKAAIVARDVQSILDDFDPLVYLPSLFARYAQLLHGAYAEIEAHWRESDRPSLRILVQFYRSNLAGFLEESS